VSRQGSAFSFYLMPEVPSDFHDIILHHDFANDVKLRRALLESGVFFVPIATKQCSISYAHTAADIDFTLERLEHAVARIWRR
jgi:glutamate-1-semialdehyde 2,1-aminomutase